MIIFKMVLNDLLNIFTFNLIELILSPMASISHLMSYGGPDFIAMLQKNNKMTRILFYFC